MSKPRERSRGSATVSKIVRAVAVGPSRARTPACHALRWRMRLVGREGDDRRVRALPQLVERVVREQRTGHSRNHAKLPQNHGFHAGLPDDLPLGLFARPFVEPGRRPARFSLFAAPHGRRGRVEPAVPPLTSAIPTSPAGAPRVRHTSSSCAAAIAATLARATVSRVESRRGVTSASAPLTWARSALCLCRQRRPPYSTTTGTSISSSISPAPFLNPTECTMVNEPFVRRLASFAHCRRSYRCRYHQPGTAASSPFDARLIACRACRRSTSARASSLRSSVMKGSV